MARKTTTEKAEARLIADEALACDSLIKFMGRFMHRTQAECAEGLRRIDAYQGSRTKRIQAQRQRS